MFEAWLFVLPHRARLPDTVDFVLYDLFSIFSYICAQRSAVEYSDISFQVQEAQNMVTNVRKHGTFPAYSCFSTIDSFRFQEIVTGNGAFQEI